MRSIIHNLVIVLVLAFWFADSADAQIRHITNTSMPIVAKVVKDQSGNPVVIYNPNRCAKMGAACGFFMAHEYAHIQLNHFGRRTPTMQAELEADCWAARNVSPSTLAAARRWMMAGNSGHVHGTGPQRAVRIGICAGR